MSMAEPRSWREALLNDPKLHASVRRTLRSRDVPKDAIEDLKNETLKRAWASPSLPEGEDAAARKYVNGIATNVACDRMREASEEEAEPLDETALSVPVSAAASLEARDLLAKTMVEVRTRFPRTFDWFWRSHVLDEPMRAIARREGVSDGHVRHEVSDIRRSMLAVATQLSAVTFVVLLVVFGLRRVLWQGDRPKTGPDLAQSGQHPEVTPSQQAAVLRLRAADECAAEKWGLCIDDLDDARSLDPKGEAAPSVQELRRNAESHLPPPSHFNSDSKGPRGGR
jgi:DNA-directed RNA polymerase specialized sigma24 family protein